MLEKAQLMTILVSLVLAVASQPVVAQEVRPQQVEPIVNFTPSKDLGTEVFLPPSQDLDEELAPDARLLVPDSDVGYFLGAPLVAPGQPPLSQPFVQRLRGQTFLLLYNAFASLVYRGERGLLMVDCGGHFGQPERDRLLAGLAAIGGWDSPAEVGAGLPLDTLVVTHTHADHCGNSLFLKESFPDLRIVASRWYDDEVRLNMLPLARPTQMIRQRFSSFAFEGKQFTFNTPVRSAHTGADSYVITPDKVLMAVDFVQADRTPFIEVSVVRDLLGYVQFLRYLAGEAQAGNWEVASWGHFNVGYPRDVQLILDYLEALFNAWTFAFLNNPIENFVDPQDPASELNIAVPLNNFFDKVAEDMFFAVAHQPLPGKPGRTWGETRFFELGRDHADRVHELRFLSFFNSFEFEKALASGDPNAVIELLDSRVPDFEPIPPGRRLYSGE